MPFCRVGAISYFGSVVMVDYTNALSISVWNSSLPSMA